MTPEQLVLFEDFEPEGKLENGSSNFSDPAFAGNKTLAVHRWVPWIAGFSSEFVADVLQRYLRVPGWVLDPFAGVGTTLVESILHGHQSSGFEINPYAALASRIKANAHRIDHEKLQSSLKRFQAFYRQQIANGYVPRSTPPTGFRTRSAFYNPKVLHKVLILQDFIADIKDDEIRALFRLAFAATMVRYSNYSYEPSLGRRVSAGKEEIIDYPVGETVISKLREMVEDIAWFQAQFGKEVAAVEVINDSFFAYQTHLDPAVVDLIITSPPYLNNYHYNRNTRPQLYWLGFAERPKDIKPLEQANFGKYWQTVRNRDTISLDFSLSDSDLRERLEVLRQCNPEKGVYGGHGWANYATAYFNDCYRFAKGMRYALKPGGVAVIVIGNNILQGVMIPTDRYLGQIAEHAGLEWIKTEIPRATRVGNSIIQSDVRVGKAKKNQQLYEAIVELRRS